MSLVMPQSKEAVNDFLEDMHHALNVELRIIPRPINKDFMIQYGLIESDVKKILLKLTCSNYSVTDLDQDSQFDGEVWIFGKALYDSMEFFKESVIIYIKLKIKDGVVCLSLHEAKWPLEYPYLGED